MRPVLAGICLGLLSYKPQYGPLLPVVLIAAAQWRVFFSAAVTAIILAFVSWLAFGSESWQAFFHWLPMFSQAFLTEGKAPWWKMQSLFALVRYFGGTEQLAWAFHGILTGSVATVLALIWRSRVPYPLKAAALAAGTLLTTPYHFMYDMMVLAIPVAFLIRVGLKSGFRPYELFALACALAVVLRLRHCPRADRAVHDPLAASYCAARRPVVATRAGALAGHVRRITLANGALRPCHFDTSDARIRLASRSE
jgi:glycosyl transferase family 87